MIRPAAPNDVGRLAELLTALIAHDKGSNAPRPPVLASQVQQSLFGLLRSGLAWVAEAEGELVGFALVSFNSAILMGTPGWHLQHLFVEERSRHRGYGLALFQQAARHAFEQGHGQLEWSVADSNAQAIQFYEQLGGKRVSRYSLYRLDGPAFDRLIGSTDQQK